jgi:cytochrome c oxidase subunit 3
MVDAAHQHHPEHKMGLPLTNGKLAMWLFLVTEIMFFTGLIGTYLILRNGTPTKANPWPAPHAVHVDERLGAGNTFVLICSSLTVVLAHYAIARNQIGKAMGFIGATLGLGIVFLVVKYVEYKGKAEHGILPGYVFDTLDGFRTASRPNWLTRAVMPDFNFDQNLAVDGDVPRIREGQAGPMYVSKIRWQAEQALKHHHLSDDAKADITRLLADTEPAVANENIVTLNTQGAAIGLAAVEFTPADTGKLSSVLRERSKQSEDRAKSDAGHAKELKAYSENAADLAKRVENPPLAPAEVARRVRNPKYVKGEKDSKEEPGLLDKYDELHMSPLIPNGNLWSSCYFVMTGFHALHVIGGLVIFVLILVLGALGRLGPQHSSMFELTGLYWHFVDIVWIFLFPLLYLV